MNAQPPKPSILCFHGSGSNAMIFNVQLARLARLLRPTFDLVILDAPFVGAPGPGVLPFFEDCGPYAYWTHPARNGTTGADRGTGIESVMLPEVVDVITKAVREVEANGGEVVGACGFSQGSRVVAGLLKAQEEVERRGGDGPGGLRTRLRFGVSFMGSYPPPLLPAELQRKSGDADAVGEERIKTPTLHVAGANDKWNFAGEKMVNECFDTSTAKSVIVQTEHHMPISVEENEMVKEEIMKLWKGSK
ncbi:uncharacterized protein BDZ99DRAFT_565320 [Mytilinidion resinicola]|uniref:Serine hydrolase domain-containing protein n=1 Tax=Mytilinidion resinicola TaxID=574789 RepID=A0A6A6ZA79_9PEZI|nr:uncharacterized protein BDZ99DRAFT_565320 [Mytilinidion resinicola]KAF2817599.1 hypothetical protein BDZ99DRAFT_565320 [Mytilinidion resinicola]